MSKRIKDWVTRLTLIAFLISIIPLIPMEKAEAVTYYPPYKLGLSSGQVYNLTHWYNKTSKDPDNWYHDYDDNGIKCAQDYRHIRITGRPDYDFKPKSQFSLYVNGEYRKVSYSENNLDLPPSLVEINSSDEVRLKDISTPYPGNTLAAWDLQYRVMPVPNESVRDIQDYRKHYAINNMLADSQSVANRWPYKSNGEGINLFFQEAWNKMKSDYPDTDCYIELYLEVQDKDSRGYMGWSDNGDFAMLKTRADGSPYPMGNV